MFLEPLLLGSLMYSLAVSVKMNILLYSPALLLVYLAVLGFRNTVLQVRVFAKVQVFFAVLRIHGILGWIRTRIRIRGSMPLTNGSGSGSRIRIPDPDLSIFVIDLQDASKKLIFEHNFFCL